MAESMRKKQTCDSLVDSKIKRGKKVAVSISYSDLYWALEEEVIGVSWAELSTDSIGENGKRPMAIVLQPETQMPFTTQRLYVLRKDVRSIANQALCLSLHWRLPINHISMLYPNDPVRRIVLPFLFLNEETEAQR